ncbi:MAG: C40 family peptidase [Dermatophilaceae bacterium]
MLGIPYLFGGESPSTGFDCSAFTQYVFGKAGVDIPRTASEQQDSATSVTDPQPGDLVFFGSPAWHVGIYTGNGMMIDSPRTGKSTDERAVFSGVSGYGRF